jgi:ABC-type transport system involved in cytochrome bd biosynthesis fused ATPase/permease subunit
MPTYQLQNLTVRHLGARSSSALQAIDLTIEQGEQIALIGPSGAGKTTLLATLSLSHQPAEGSFMPSARIRGRWAKRRVTACARSCSWRRKRRRCRRASAW